MIDTYDQHMAYSSADTLLWRTIFCLASEPLFEFWTHLDSLAFF